MPKSRTSPAIIIVLIIVIIVIVIIIIIIIVVVFHVVFQRVSQHAPLPSLVSIRNTGLTSCRSVESAGVRTAFSRELQDTASRASPRYFPQVDLPPRCILLEQEGGTLAAAKRNMSLISHPRSASTR